MSKTPAARSYQPSDGETGEEGQRIHQFIRLMRYVVRYWYLLVLGLCLIVITSYLGVVPGLKMREVLNALTPPSDQNVVFEILSLLRLAGASRARLSFAFAARHVSISGRRPCECGATMRTNGFRGVA